MLKEIIGLYEAPEILKVGQEKLALLRGHNAVEAAAETARFRRIRKNAVIQGRGFLILEESNVQTAAAPAVEEKIEHGGLEYPLMVVKTKEEIVSSIGAQIRELEEIERQFTKAEWVEDILCKKIGQEIDQGLLLLAKLIAEKISNQDLDQIKARIRFLRVQRRALKEELKAEAKAEAAEAKAKAVLAAEAKAKAVLSAEAKAEAAEAKAVFEAAKADAAEVAAVIEDSVITSISEAADVPEGIISKMIQFVPRAPQLERMKRAIVRKYRLLTQLLDKTLLCLKAGQTSDYTDVALAFQEARKHRINLRLSAKIINITTVLSNCYNTKRRLIRAHFWEISRGFNLKRDMRHIIQCLLYSLAILPKKAAAWNAASLRRINKRRKDKSLERGVIRRDGIVEKEIFYKRGGKTIRYTYEIRR